MPQQVLLADDDRAIRESVARALELEGYEVIAVGDGEQALEAVADQQPDVLVLDEVLPAALPLTAATPNTMATRPTPVAAARERQLRRQR